MHTHLSFRVHLPHLKELINVLWVLGLYDKYRSPYVEIWRNQFLKMNATYAIISTDFPLLHDMHKLNKNVHDLEIL